jgi:hypothetical protein
VQATISDKKLGILQDERSTFAGYEADLLSAVDYYPFGMQMPGRNLGTDSYRYGMNTQEKDDEIYGQGNTYSAEFWEYDARLGRRWNVDPVFKEYESAYAAFSGNPIWLIDPTGADTSYADKHGKVYDCRPGGENKLYRDSVDPVSVVATKKPKPSIFDFPDLFFLRLNLLKRGILVLGKQDGSHSLAQKGNPAFQIDIFDDLFDMIMLGLQGTKMEKLEVDKLEVVNKGIEVATYGHEVTLEANTDTIKKIIKDSIITIFCVRFKEGASGKPIPDSMIEVKHIKGNPQKGRVIRTFKKSKR